MSNRQARREQSRSSRTAARNKRTARPAPGKAPKQGGGGPDLFSLPYLIGLSVVIVALAIVLIFVAGRGGSGESDMVAALQEAHENFPQELANGVSVGDPNAPLKLDMYEDFQCIFCLRHTAEAEPTLVEEYVKSGKLQITYNHLAVIPGAESIRAAIASQCAADQDRFWDYHNKLFTYQAEQGPGVNKGYYSDSNLRNFATELGLDIDEFNQCFDSDKHLGLIQQQQRTANAYGLTGTPSFVLNGQPLGSGGFDLDGWRRLLDEAYANATASPTPGDSASPSPAAETTPTPGN